MQKFILLRGHEGSGKSTFAVALIAEFLQHYPQAKIVHLDNDMALTDDQGVYHFDFERFAVAHRANQQAQLAAFEWAKAHFDQPILVVNANPNQKARPCETMIATAQAYGLVVEVYRLHNFYPNIHYVKDEDVLRGYLRLNRNPVAHEIHLPPSKPMPDGMRLRLAEMAETVCG